MATKSELMVYLGVASENTSNFLFMQFPNSVLFTFAHALFDELYYPCYAFSCMHPIAQPVPPNAGDHVPIRLLPPAYDDHLPNWSTARALLPPPVPPPCTPSSCPGIPPPLTLRKLRPGAPPVIPPAPVHPTCTHQVPKWPDNAYGDKHPVEQVKEIEHTKHWHDIVWEPGPSRQIPDEPASWMPGNFPNTSALPAQILASTESDSEADVEWLCHEGGAGLATFLMSKAIPHKADSAESKPLCEWTYKDI